MADKRKAVNSLPSLPSLYPSMMSSPSCNGVHQGQTTNHVLRPIREIPYHGCYQTQILSSSSHVSPSRNQHLNIPSKEQRNCSGPQGSNAEQSVNILSLSSPPEPLEVPFPSSQNTIPFGLHTRCATNSPQFHPQLSLSTSCAKFPTTYCSPLGQSSGQRPQNSLSKLLQCVSHPCHRLCHLNSKIPQSLPRLQLPPREKSSKIPRLPSLSSSQLCCSFSQAHFSAFRAVDSHRTKYAPNTLPNLNPHPIFPDRLVSLEEAGTGQNLNRKTDDKHATKNRPPEDNSTYLHCNCYPSSNTGQLSAYRHVNFPNSTHNRSVQPNRIERLCNLSRFSDCNHSCDPESTDKIHVFSKCSPALLQQISDLEKRLCHSPLALKSRNVSIGSRIDPDLKMLHANNAGNCIVTPVAFGQKPVRRSLIDLGFPATDEDAHRLMADTPGLSDQNLNHLRLALFQHLSKVRKVANKFIEEIDAFVDSELSVHGLATTKKTSISIEQRFEQVVSRFCKARMEIIRKFRGYIRNRKWIENVATRQRRGCLSHRQNNILRLWLFSNFDNPYPRAIDKEILVQRTKLSSTQINNWLINARSRVWKPTVESMSGEGIRRELFIKTAGRVKEETEKDSDRHGEGFKSHTTPD